MLSHHVNADLDPPLHHTTWFSLSSEVDYAIPSYLPPMLVALALVSQAILQPVCADNRNNVLLLS